MESDKQRWLEAVTPKLSENPNECIYEEWDCPQVIALYEFTPVQPDELNLCIGDVVNVLKKMSDGTLSHWRSDRFHFVEISLVAVLK